MSVSMLSITISVHQSNLCHSTSDGFLLCAVPEGRERELPILFHCLSLLKFTEPYTFKYLLAL